MLIHYTLIRAGVFVFVFFFFFWGWIKCTLHPLSLRLILIWFLNFQNLQFTLLSITTMLMQVFCSVIFLPLTHSKQRHLKKKMKIIFKNIKVIKQNKGLFFFVVDLPQKSIITAPLQHLLGLFS